MSSRVILKIKFNLLFTVFLVFLTGCAGQKIASSGTPAHDLKKKILVLPILNFTGIDETKAQQIRSQLLEALQSNPQILIQDEMSFNTSDFEPPKVMLPEFGLWSDPALLKRAENEGQSILLLPILNPFEYTEIRTGIWPLLKSKQEMKISLTLNAFDPVNRLVAMLHLEAQKITLPRSDLLGFELEEQTGPEQKWQSISEETWRKIWSKIIARQADVFQKNLSGRAWTGLVLSRESDTVLINAGRDIGLREGLVLEAFEKSVDSQGVAGPQTLAQGLKTGEIRVTQIMDKTALAVILNLAEIKPGQLIRMKN